MTAKEYAEKYAGKLCRCVITKSKPPTGVKWVSTNSGQAYEGRILGWKKDATAEFIIIEVLPPGQTTFMVRDMQNVHWTHKTDAGKYAKRVYVEEIVEIVEKESPLATPSKGAPRVIPIWPHSCPICKSPALHMGMMIDCSNDKCIHKYKSRDAKDLFMPKNMRPADADVKFDGHGPEINDDGFIVCGTCKGIAVDGKINKASGSIGGSNKTAAIVYAVSCEKGHRWNHTVKIGHKMKTSTRTIVFDGKVFKAKA
jgi:hypothetical protein